MDRLNPGDDWRRGLIEGIKMRMKTSAWLVCALTLLIAGCKGPGDPGDPAGDSVYQLSTIDSLLAGQYGPLQSLGELRTHGDFGIGTFEHLNGEMLAFDGRFYQVASTGKVALMGDDVMSPFATVKFFHADQTAELVEPLSLAELGQWVDARLPTKNWFYAVRIDGEFEFVRTRSVPAQKAPYAPLVEVVKTQPVWTIERTRGTLVGFRCPDYSRGMNVPGYHWHYITDDHTAGGHVQDLRIKSVSVRIDQSRQWQVWLPDDEGFRTLDLGRDRGVELNKVEK
jgi:acetolactate decarboxylase